MNILRGLVGTVTLSLLAGCQTGFFSLATPTPSLPNPTQPVPTLVPPNPADAEPTPVPTLVDNTTLTMWLPPQFSPLSGNPSGDILKERLAAFQASNPSLHVVVRIKAVNGAAGLLESLTDASSAAPGSLPDLIALPRPDMEAAAIKGLLTPFDGLFLAPKESDWFDYAHQLMRLQNSVYGLPFAGDALVMVYRPARVSPPPADWKALANLAQPVIFPASDPTALLTLALYQAAGGQTRDNQGRPALDHDHLLRVLTLFRSGLDTGTFPAGIALFDSDTQIWQAFHDQKDQVAFTWVSHFLAEIPPDAAVQNLPEADNHGQTLATAWLFALPGQNPVRRAAAVKLAEFLVQSDFLSRWTSAAGYLPPRPSALAGWTNRSLQSQLNQIEVSAVAQPDGDVLGSLGPILRDAAVQVLKGQGDPEQVTQSALLRMQSP